MLLLFLSCLAGGVGGWVGGDQEYTVARLTKTCFQNIFQIFPRLPHLVTQTNIVEGELFLYKL